MIHLLQDRVDAFLGRGVYSLAVPVMDGPLQPNQRLEQAPTVASAYALDNLVEMPDGMHASSGASLLKLDAGQVQAVATLEREVSCLVGDGSGALAVGLSGLGVIVRGGAYDGRSITKVGDELLHCPVAALFIDGETLVVANGSARHRPDQWVHDLMRRESSGSVWRISLATGHAEPLARGLGWPYGLALASDGRLLVSEAWRHRIVAVSMGRAEPPEALLQDLPGHPARLAPAAGGGFWLAVFAPRNQLIEFVLQERAYRERMIATIEPQHWIAPALSSGASFREPIQGGAIKTMGILKPWAPTRSYGLVVRLDADLLPIDSLHSRAGGRMHGVTSICEHDNRLFVAAKGPGHALAVELGAPSDREPR